MHITHAHRPITHTHFLTTRFTLPSLHMSARFTHLTSYCPHSHSFSPILLPHHHTTRHLTHKFLSITFYITFSHTSHSTQLATFSSTFTFTASHTTRTSPHRHHLHTFSTLSQHTSTLPHNITLTHFTPCTPSHSHTLHLFHTSRILSQSDTDPRRLLELPRVVVRRLALQRRGDGLLELRYALGLDLGWPVLLARYGPAPLPPQELRA